MTARRDPATVVASAGIAADPGRDSLVPPVWVSDTYRWADADTKPDYDCSRAANPNRDLIADLKRGFSNVNRGS